MLVKYRAQVHLPVLYQGAEAGGVVAAATRLLVVAEHVVRGGPSLDVVDFLILLEHLELGFCVLGS